MDIWSKYYMKGEMRTLPIEKIITPMGGSLEVHGSS